jgi:hypothetical protein
MVETEIAGEVRNEPLEIPEVVVVNAPIFVSRTSHTFEIDLIIEPMDAGPVVKMVSCDIQIEIFNEMNDMIQEVKKADGLNDIVVSFGKPAYSEWKYLD